MGRENSVEGSGFKVMSADDSLDAELDRSVPSSVPLAYAVVLAGDQPGRVYILHRNTSLIGRLESADVALSDASVSGRHARILNGSRGFEIEDLQSTNGTVIGGQRVTRAPLRNGDRVTVGNVDFIFLLERPMSATLQIPGPGAVTGVHVQQPPRHTLPALYTPLPPRGQPILQAPTKAPANDADDGVSLRELIAHLVHAVRYVGERRRTVAIIVAVCSALGVASMLVVPPRSQAVIELKLLSQAKDNPVDQWRPPDEQAQTFFQAPERSFTHTELVAATLAKLEGTPSTEARVTEVASRLKLDSMGDHIYRASFTDPVVGRRGPPVAAFLMAHTKAYVQKAIDQALREFNAKVTFLRDQVKAVNGDLARISEQLTSFRAQNADRLPEDALQTHTARFQLEGRRADLTGQVRLLEGQLQSARAQLKKGRPLVEARFQATQSDRESLATTNRKLSEAYASGLADGHPEVQRLMAEKERLEALIKTELHTENGALEADTDPASQAARTKVEGLEAQLAAARNDLADTQKNLSQVRNVVGDLPRVEARVVKLTTDQESQTKLSAQLFDKLKQAELQLNLEQVSMQSRYDIGRLVVVRPSTASRLVLRLLMGLFAGLFVAIAWLGFNEARRYVVQVMTTMDELKPPFSRS
jgi:pSer/pThr/pTyr-binding forkhead associated (FHA) protein